MSNGSPKPPIRDYLAERRLLLTRLAIIGGIMLVLLGLVVGRLYYLQIQRYGYYAGRSTANRTRVQPVAPVRGLIYDRNGRLLAGNRPSYSLVITPDDVPDLKRTLKRLTRLVGLDRYDIKRFRRKMHTEPGFRAIPICLNLGPRQVDRFEVNRQNFPGVDIKAGLTRYYPLGAAAAHVVGYVGSITQRELSHVSASQYQGTDRFGKTGVELSYQNLLHGLPGSRTVEVNAEGRPLHKLGYKPPHSGDNLYLTLNAQLQKAAYNAMGKQSGAVVALNPSTGAILAMVSTPSFNPGLFVNGISEKNYLKLNDDPRQPLFNRDIHGQYPPGSTIKPAMALAGLDTDGGKYIHPRFDPGYYRLPGHSHVYHNWNPNGFGHVDLHRAIELSDDVYFYSLAHDLGIDRIHAFLSKFGLGRPTGVDLPNEASGILPSRAWKKRTQGHIWYPGDTLNTGIGQGYLSVTPLQLALMVSRIATHGKGARPHILYATQNPVTGKIKRAPIHRLPPIKLNNPHDWQRVISGMHAVINNPHGTAHEISYGLTFSAAGKTGTSQLGDAGVPADANKPQSQLPRRLRDDALFISFAPVNHPRIAVAVMVEHGGYGAAAAAPVARHVMNAYLGPHGVAPPLKQAANAGGKSGSGRAS